MKVKALIIEKEEVDFIEISSNLIDVIYELIKGTYKKEKRINIGNPTDKDRNVLSDFFTYILHYPLNVETPEVIVNENHIDNNNNYCNKYKGRELICFSGGTDSTAALLKSLEEGNDPVAIWADYGQPYRISEKHCVEKICKKLNVSLIEAVLDISDLIASGGKRFGHIFPARNLLIAAIGLCFQPKDMQLAGLCDELIVPDKSLRMYDEFGKLFGVSLTSPFIDKSKADVLCIWQKKWIRYLDANETISCYDDIGNCQNCSSCAKREVAFVASGYHKVYPEVFTNQHRLIEEHWFSRIDVFQYERRTDMLIALNYFIDKLTPELQELVSVNWDKYREEIERRKKELKEEGGTLYD